MIYIAVFKNFCIFVLESGVAIRTMNYDSKTFYSI